MMDNLDINADAQQIDGQTDGAAPATTDPAQADVATQTTTEPEAPIVDTATDDRYKQDNAQLRATLQKIGLDPDGIDAENIRNGYISVDDYMASKYGQPAAAAAPTNEPELTLAEKIQNFQASVSNVDGQVSVDDYKTQLLAAADVLGSLAQENNNLRQERQQDKTQTVLDNCMNTCRTTYQSNDTFKGLPPEAQAQAAQFIESATDVAVGRLAQQIGFDRAANQQVYQAETSKVLQSFTGLVQALSGQAPTPPQPTNVASVAPQVMGQGPSQPISTPRPKMSIENIQDNVNKYLASQSVQV